MRRALYEGIRFGHSPTNVASIHDIPSQVGRKKLFIDHNSVMTEMSPLCVLDFYVHESKQRSGYATHPMPEIAYRVFPVYSVTMNLNELIFRRVYTAISTNGCSTYAKQASKFCEASRDRFFSIVVVSRERSSCVEVWPESIRGDACC